jgi:thiamine biosynthesis lipoprotein
MRRAAWVASLVAGFSACAMAGPPLQRFAFEKTEMGLPFRIVLFAPDEAAADAGARAAFERIEHLNRVLSDYDPDSELSRLGRTSGSGEAVVVTRDLWTVIERAQNLAEQTGGAFDLTVGPLVNTWRRARRKRELPSETLLAEMKARVGWQHVELDRNARSVRLLMKDMRLDAGGIAKGYALDAALEILVQRGLHHALLSGGGDFRAGDAPPGTNGWKVEIAPLDAPGAPPAQVMLLSNEALATSGDIFQHVEIGGVRYSHIVDPRSGMGLTDHSLVSVRARDAITADSLATAISVLGPDEGLALAERTSDVAARVVRRQNETIEVRYSTAWPTPE